MKGQNVFRKAVGSIGLVAQVSRPDLSYALINFACKAGRATVVDGRKIARMINKLAETKYDINWIYLQSQLCPQRGKPQLIRMGE